MAKTDQYLVTIRIDGDEAVAATIRVALIMAMQMHNIKGEVQEVRGPMARKKEIANGKWTCSNCGVRVGKAALNCWSCGADFEN